jgi:hypothetical protein
MYEISWVVDYLDDLEVDFLVLYQIQDPWSLPGPKFFQLASRTFYYQGTMAYRAMEEHEDQDPSRGRYAEQQIDHNTAAAKAAGKGLKDQEVTYVPLSTLMNMAGADGSYAQAGS